MSFCPTALTALEHDTARRPQPLDVLDRGRLLRDRPVAIPAAAAADDAPPQGADEVAPEAHTAPPAPRDPAREALERTCLTVKRIACDIGMPRATLEAYRLGTRRMPPAARARLGAYLAAHAAMLDDLAQALMSPTTHAAPLPVAPLADN